MFTPDQIRAHFAQMEREQNEQNGDVSEDNDPPRERPAAALEAVRQFMMIKDLLSVTALLAKPVAIRRACTDFGRVGVGTG